MDPTQCLKGILETLKTAAESEGGMMPEECLEMLEDLQALGDWIRAGGFLPSQWRK